MNLSGRPLRGTALDAPLFVGRDAELAALERAIELGLNALVLGARGAGATSLLFHLAGRIEGRRVAVVNGAPAQTPADLLATVGDHLPLRADRPVAGRMTPPAHEVPRLWPADSSTRKLFRHLGSDNAAAGRKPVPEHGTCGVPVRGTAARAASPRLFEE